ncbi:MAG: hypothetical protein KF852_18330 [Saprospiraceae bacterium]|nr:hypothetical protein [Saprospiraceae bacterium]
MSYILTLTTESYLLTGSGEGGVLIDADVVFHRTGFPMIPARRIKGMLKESLEEVMEIAGKTETDIKAVVAALFGESGKTTYQGKLLLHNLLLPEWEQIAKEVSENKMYPGFQSDFIKEYFTAEIQQTAIGREGKEGEIEGVAKKRSLRNYRVIKPGFTFDGFIETTPPLSEEEDGLLRRAVHNLRYAGTRRNRGFGKVKCKLSSPLPSQAAQGRSNSVSFVSDKLDLTITTLSPVVLAEQLGEQNTVFTRKYISGNQLRGLLANTFIRRKGLTPLNAHLDSDFFDVFLSGKVHFGNAVYRKAKPIPLHLHKYKVDENKPVISVFAKGEPDNDITKSVGKSGVIRNNKILTDGFEPKTTFNFHNSRPNRAAGRSTDNDAETGIFYYESLNEGQAFQGEITGDASVISKLRNLLSSDFRARLGRSRSAQYGRVLVSLEAAQISGVSDSLSAGKYVMTLQSPLILLNENGYPAPTVTVLQKALSAIFGNEITVEEGRVAAAFTYVEQFNAIWQAKSDKIPAFKEGSSFLIHLPEIKKAPTQLGESVDQGFGRVMFDLYKPEARYEHEVSVKNHQCIEGKTDDTVNTSHPVLTKIKEAFEQEREGLDVKSLAINTAQKAKHLNNHLIGRMERLFEHSGSANGIFEWIKETHGKPAGDALRKADLVDYDHKFNLKPHDKIGNDWRLQKLYWTTFFQTLRKKNKADGKQ